MTLADASTRTFDAQLDDLPVGRTHWRVVIAVGLGLFFDLYEVFLSGTIGTALTAFKVTGTQQQLLLASAFIGMFVGAAAFGNLADRIGRRPTFLWTLVWYSAWSLIGAFSVNAWMLVACRFIAGIGVGAQYPVSDAYLSETLPREWRGRMASWAYTFSFLAVPAVGFLALGLNAHPLFGITGWRWLLGLGAVGAICVVFLRRGLPESPRWLNRVGRFDEADASLADFARGSRVELQPIDRSAAGAAPAQASVPASGSASVPGTGPGPGDASAAAVPQRGSLWRPPYRGRLVMLVIFHLFQTFGYYGFGTLAALTLVARGYDTTSSLLYVALSYLGYPLGSLLSTPLLAKIERKWLIVGSLVALAASGLLFATSRVEALIVVFGFLTTVISNVFSNAYHIYQAEIFPTEYKASAVGWTYSLSRLSSGALPFVLVPVLNASGAGPMFTIVAVALAIVAAAVIIGGPLTMKRSLSEINP
ncbi:MFS transporter [Gryllotalpicola daejeonensis]|uniref:MFS transporter n=1 Tax=Gryllotalpicola daejeonensis TaxID=993087 RepID=A0ABP7ZLB5_9MICO